MEGRRARWGRSDRTRVIVVGAGVVGLSCAYYLARAGAEVEVLERDRIGAGASSGNAGTVSAGHPPLNRPGRMVAALRQMLDPAGPLYVKPRWDPALWRWLSEFARHCTDEHVEHAMRVMAPLGKDALALFEELIAEEGIECGYRADGYLDVCGTDAGLQSARREASIIERYGYHPEILDGDDLRRRDPAFAPHLVGGVFYPDAATLRPESFLERLAEAVRRRGGAIREGVDVRGIRLDGPRCRGVHLRRRARAADGSAHADVDADAVVLATGPFSLTLAEQVGVRLPVQPGKGYHRDLPVGPGGAPPLRVGCVLHESSVFCTPMGDVVRLAGTMEFSGHNDVMRPARLRQLTHAARGSIPAIGHTDPTSEWVGRRPMSADGLPIVGRLGDASGLFVATGHGMLGLTLGPVTGEMIARLIMDGEDPRVPPLDPARFG